jgi:hypothetical protein
MDRGIGRIPTPENKYASSIGWSPNVKVKLRREISLASENDLMRYLFSGASTTTRRSTMSGMPSVGILFRSKVVLKSAICSVSYKRDDRTLAVATISRDLQSLQTEAAMEAN